MAAQKKVQARRMAQGHYMKDAFFFMQDLQEALMEYEVRNLPKLMLDMLSVL